ncbi:MAG: SIMPL domain-containing protein [Bacteroides sp.]|nr:SIMPL domain-containing protein [Bacteroides sp.]MDE5808754.1 SIMPL domain-containing protein [Muribaculaceae bacterium]MDE6224658.1 SIMPL domain-containing protein [Muribaculaceae bacterium]
MKKQIPYLIIAVAIILLGLTIKAGMDNFSYRDRLVSVRGLAEKEVMANKVTWPIVIKQVGNSLNEIYSGVQKTNSTILEFLKANGIEESEISVNAPELVDIRADRYNTNPIPYNYNLTSVIVVSSSKVDLVRSLIAKQMELLRDGVAIVNGGYQYPVKYEYTDLNSIKPEMIAEATAKAREAGQQFATDSKSRLGKIKTASQGQFSISDRDENTPYIKKVRVVSNIQFYLED